MLLYFNRLFANPNLPSNVPDTPCMPINATIKATNTSLAMVGVFKFEFRVVVVGCGLKVKLLFERGGEFVCVKQSPKDSCVSVLCGFLSNWFV